MNATEREAIILNTAWQAIDTMVNRSMFVGFDDDQPTGLLPKAREHALLFVILLRDFLSEEHSSRQAPVPFGLSKPPRNAGPIERTFILHLRQVHEQPSLGTKIEPLREQTEAFADWLEGSFEEQGVNLCEIDLVCDLRVERYKYLQMCGDIAKHSLPRLSVNARYLRKLLNGAGHEITEEQSYLAIPSFFNWLFDDCFMYSASRIAEFLNEIRWAIFEYLKLEFQRAWYPIDDIACGYHVPPEIKEPAAHAMYWDLMNRVRGKPWIPRFVVSEYLKRRH